jgi:hypothetical protein
MDPSNDIDVVTDDMLQFGCCQRCYKAKGGGLDKNRGMPSD